MLVVIDVWDETRPFLVRHKRLIRPSHLTEFEISRLPPRKSSTTARCTQLFLRRLQVLCSRRRFEWEDPHNEPIAAVLQGAVHSCYDRIRGGGAGIVTDADWRRPVLTGTAIFSSAAPLLYWDGSMQMLVEKGRAWAAHQCGDS